MLVECSYCAAPLNVKDGARQVKCCYCDKKNNIAQTKQLGATPPQWNPPQAWTPPVYALAPARTLNYHKHHGRLMAFIIVGSVGIPLLGGIVAALANSPAVEQASWDEESTYECKHGQHLEMEGLDVDVKSGPVFKLSHNCELRLKNSTLKGTDGIVAEGRAKIILENVTIKTERHAIKVGTFGEVEITGGKIQSERSAIELKHADLTIDGKAVIEAKHTAIEAKSHAAVDVISGKVKGDIGIECEGNNEIEVAGTVEGKDSGVSGQNRVKLRVKEGGVVKGGEYGYKAGTFSELNCKKGTLKGSVAAQIDNHSKVFLKKCKLNGERRFEGRFTKVDES